MSVRTKLWTREEYERLVEVGAFRPEARVQLIEGEIVEMMPQRPAHATAMRRVSRALETAFPRGYDVRPQLPLSLGELSEPEPDVAVVPGSAEDYRDTHPSSAVLVVEVADTTLEFDRARKLAMYAAARIPEYWIVNLVDRMLEVYREPQGSGYRTTRPYGPGDAVAPHKAPVAEIRVADLLP
ncbi:MAG: Uma2 family endonuclease [Armatimonadota bacterium]